MPDVQISDPYQQRILLRCLEFQREIDTAEEPPSEEWWNRKELARLREHGPQYQLQQWFGTPPESVRQRLRRAISRLESSGLLTVHRPFGKRLSNIKLTDAGLEIASSLPEDAANGAETT